ncbi:putative ribosomal protein [Microdochium trichocladiopsis]|uniref:Ribosomal protein n=1 Tax=Microdochium trichocladiopsis TaxID=1682393 RepID=A0A9P8YHZ4_9PEZI|nr:putative ribosomal protein [Microdochium trichocladiopsis]KAH7040293.1 putative ribosomal protein [Microdochium trichocladiopsis]
MRATASLFKKFRKLPLTTKDVNKGYYKGNRTGSMGRHTKYGGYVVDYSKVRTYVVPDLTDFQLTPFVTAKIENLHGRYEGYTKGPASPELYLERWKSENGLD